MKAVLKGRCEDHISIRSGGFLGSLRRKRVVEKHAPELEQCLLDIRKESSAVCYPDIGGTHVRFQFEDGQWQNVQPLYYDYGPLKWEYRQNSQNSWKFLDRWSQKDIDSDQPLFIRCLLSNIHASIAALFQENRRLVRDYNRLSSYEKITGEDIFEMLMREPRPEDSAIYGQVWPQSAVKELGLDGTPQRVNII